MARDQDEQMQGALEEAPGRGFFGNIRFWGGMGAGALLVLFLLQNLQEVQVDFLWWSYEIQMVFALLIAAVLGAVTALFFTFMRRRARRQERRERRRD
jgi:uncharacterized integral membrane protein